MKIIQTVIVGALPEAIRLNTYCENFIDFFESRKSVKKAIAKGAVLLNNKVIHGGTWLREDDVISIIELDNKPPKCYERDIPVVFEDDYLAILNKPAGLTVSGNQFDTLFNALSYNLEPSHQSNALPWPLPVHRLDNQTSGLIIIAKTKTARIALGNMFEVKAIEKTYQAIASGQFTDQIKSKGFFNQSIENKEALTNFKILSESRSLKNDWLTLIELYPQTGRTHQLRIHLADNGCPILGDKIYNETTIKHKGLFLCAHHLKFVHPITNKPVDISIKIPEKFNKRLRSEESRWQRYQSK